MRTFIALPLPAGVIAMLAETQRRLKDHGIAIRWVRPENIHLTIKFLGEIPTERIEALTRAMQVVGSRFQPLSLTAGGVGVFPGIKRPRVLWAGLQGDIEALGALYRALDRGLWEIGFPSEKRSFKGHLTLGRIKKRIDSRLLGHAMADVGSIQSDVFKADEMILFRSDLKPQGAVYTEIERVPLLGEDPTKITSLRRSK